MYLILWQFRVAPGQRAEFVRRYASDGDGVHHAFAKKCEGLTLAEQPLGAGMAS